MHWPVFDPQAFNFHLNIDDWVDSTFIKLGTLLPVHLIRFKIILYHLQNGCHNNGLKMIILKMEFFIFPKICSYMKLAECKIIILNSVKITFISLICRYYENMCHVDILKSRCLIIRWYASKKNMQVLSTNYLLRRVGLSQSSNLIGIFRQWVWEITDIKKDGKTAWSSFTEITHPFHNTEYSFIYCKAKIKSVFNNKTPWLISSKRWKKIQPFFRRHVYPLKNLK